MNIHGHSTKSCFKNENIHGHPYMSIIMFKNDDFI